MIKISAVAASTVLALGHSPKEAKAQSKSPEASALQLGVPLLGPTPASFTPPHSICWRPGTTAAEIAAYKKANPETSLDSPFAPFRIQNRWTTTATNPTGLKRGDATVITYSIVPDGTQVPNRSGSGNQSSNLKAYLNSIYGSEAVWKNLFVQVGAALSAKTGLTYVYEPNDDGVPLISAAGQLGVRGDVRVSGANVDGTANGGSGPVLAYNYYPDISDMVIDTSESFFRDTSNNSLGFRNTITHEFGHGLGLNHSCPVNETKLMEPTVSDNFDGPQLDDVLALQRSYGDPLEKQGGNDTPAKATDLGILNDGNTVRDTVSIDGSATSDGTDDIDYYQFRTSSAKSVSVRLTPTGATFLTGSQNSDGSCESGTPYNSRTVNNLGFELLSAAPNGGFTTLATANSAAVGDPEVVDNLTLTGTGPFYVRVFGDTDGEQAYSLSMAIGPPGTPIPTPTPTTAPTPAPTPIRPVVDLNGGNIDGSTGQDNPNANGIDIQTIYPEGAGPVTVAPPAIVLSDISAQPIDSNFIGAKLTEARVRIAPFPEDAINPRDPFDGAPGAPDNRPNFTGLNRNDIEVLDIPMGIRDFLAGRGGRPDSGLTLAYDNRTQTFTITGGTAPDFVANKLDFIRQSYQIALSSITYENKFFRGSTDPTLNRKPFTRSTTANNPPPDRFITFVVDTDNDATNNIDDRFVPQDPGNPKQSKPATANLVIGDRQSLVVTTLADSSNPRDGFNSLREAINFANTDGKDSAITFAGGLVSAASPGTISLTGDLPTIQERNQPIVNPLPVIKTSITGPGPRLLNIQANGNATFNSQALPGARNGSRDSLAISGLSITGAGGFGISTTNGDLTVDRCIVRGGSDDGINSFISGGANVASVLSVTNSSISNNRGFGITTFNGRTAAKTTTISNSTVSTNLAGISVTSRVINLVQNQPADPTTVSLCTVANNSSFGIRASSNAVINTNDTISYNNDVNDVTSDGGGGNGGANIPGVFVTQKGNLIGAGDAIGQFTDASDQKGVDPLLGPLTNNGGDSDTHALRTGSPAREKGVAPTGTAPATDQRGTGFARVVGTIDVGAFEAQTIEASLTVVISPRNPNQNTVLTATATATGNNADGTPITTLFYRWLINGREVQAGPDNTLDLRTQNVKNGDIVTVIVARNQANANDATQPQGTDSVPVTVVIVNSAPNLTSVTIAPATPLTNQTVTATAVANDAQNDPITYSFTWKVNGTVVRRFTTSNRTDSLDLSVQGNGNRGDTVSVDVTASDNKGATSPVRTASVTVRNSAPTAQNVAASVIQGQTVEILLTGSDPDNDPLTFALASAPTQGTAIIAVNNDGRSVLYYTANADATGTETLTFTATDNNTAAAGLPTNAKTSAPGTATITIVSANPTPTPTPTTPPGPTPTPVPTPDTNRPPVVVNTSISTTREVPVSKGLGVFDPDPGDNESNITLKRASGPRKGTGEIRRDANGKWTLFYKASGLYKGNDEVKFFAIDSKGAISNVATITINLFNTAPTARSTEMQVAAGGSADVGIFGQDVDRDDLTFKSVGGPSKGTGEFRKDKNGNTRFFYQNSQVATGDDEVRFVAIDTSGKASEVAVLKIKVIGVFNRPPVANDVSATTLQDMPVNVTVSGSDPDDVNLPMGETTPLTFKRVGGPTNGTGEIRLFDDGTYKMAYTPRKGFVGTETIRYVAIDDKGKPSKPATITITVTSNTSALLSKPKPSGGSS